MAQSNRLQYLFEKHLRNQSSPAELEELVSLLNETADEALDRPMSALWEEVRDKQTANEVDWAGMLQEVKRSKRNNIRYLWTKVAAAAVLLAVIATGITYYVNKNNKINPPTEVLYAQKAVPVGETRLLVLKDGSKITLNADSRLRYPEHFDEKTREVYLEGEAMFDVTHDPERPFIVHSGQLQTEVLGTVFNISAYPGAEKMEVTVISGKVAVEETVSKRSTTLVADQKVVFNTRTANFNTRTLESAAPAVAWQKGRISFDDAALSEVTAQFYRRYGVRIILENASLADCRISIVLNNDTVDNLLKTITALTNSNYKYEGDQVILYGKGCH